MVVCEFFCRKECHCMLFLTPENDFAGEEQVTFLCIALSFFVVRTSEIGNHNCHAKLGLVDLFYFGSFSA